MLPPTVLKIAAAGLLHDVGKFAEVGETLQITEGYKESHANLYQPFKEGRHTHNHVLYTVAFIEDSEIRRSLPKVFNEPVWGDGDCLVNLAAGHHAPETPLQWIVAKADRLSSGWDRKSFDDYNRAQAPANYRNTRLRSLFESIAIDGSGKSSDEPRYAYPLASLSPASIFPEERAKVEGIGREEAKTQYAKLFRHFCEDLQRLSHKEDNIELWLEHFESLLMYYTLNIPAARAGNMVPDVSLYDHSKSTAALAVALYKFHEVEHSLERPQIEDDTAKKFLFISGDFYGIQNFIFGGGGESGKYQAKLLRGRSLMVALFSSLAADFICRKAGLPSISVLYEAGGKFVLVGPNTQQMQKTVEDASEKINEWLFKTSFGRNSMGFAIVEASGEDLTGGNYRKLAERMFGEAEIQKSNRVDLNKYGGEETHFFELLASAPEGKMCQICGLSPASSEVANDSYVKDLVACAICRDQIYLGASCVKNNRLAVTSSSAEIYERDERLLKPIFGEYQLSFIEKELGELARKGELLRHWELYKPNDAICHDNPVHPDVSLRFFSGYVPVVSSADLEDLRSKVLCEADEEQIEEGQLKTLSLIAVMARRKETVSGREVLVGQEGLGVLKADVDNLGLIMSCGFKEEKQYTLSRLSALSRQLNFFFTVHLPSLLSNELDFQNVYTVYSGGDDLFLIGPWNGSLQLVECLAADFSRYVCHNPELHFSAGISFHKPHSPLGRMAENAEVNLSTAKRDGRARVHLFGQTACVFGGNGRGSEFEKLMGIKEELAGWLKAGDISRGFLYRLGDFIEMAEKAKGFEKESEVPLSQADCLRWRALLSYVAARNVAREQGKEEREKKVQDVLVKAIKWISEFQGKLTIPLWCLLYDIRRA